MTIYLKRNDTKDTIIYTVTNLDKSVVNLTGATVKFIMGKNKTLITNAAATIVSAAEGQVSYTLTESDTLAAGTFNAEFEVTFSDGKIKTYPTDGYILVNIQANVDKNKSTYLEDRIALRVSDIELFKEEVNEKVAIAQQLIDGNFDEGLLKTNIQTKLTNLETQYAPRLNAVESSVAQTTTKLELKGTMYESGCIVAFVDDDCHSDVWTKLKPALDEISVPFSFALTSRDMDTTNRLTYAQLQQLETAGHEIVSHSYSTELHSLTTDDAIELELLNAKKFMLDKGFKGKDVIVYPTGFNEDAKGLWVKRFVRKYFKYGVNAWGNPKLPVDSYYIPRKDMHNLTLDQAKALVDEYQATNQLLVFYGHCWMGTFDAQKIKDIVAYIRSKNIPIKTLSQACELKASNNVFGEPNLGGTVIGNNGFMSTNFMKGDANTLAKKATDYPQNAVFTEFFQTWVTGLPQPSGMADYTWSRYGGVLQTIRCEDGTRDAYCTQFYTINKSYSYRFRREWDFTNKVWRPWDIDGGQLYHIGAQAPADMSTKSITYYTAKSVTVFTVDNHASLPNGIGGTVICYRAASDNHSWQEFQELGTTKRFKRHWNTGTSSWGNWELISNYFTTGTAAPTTVPLFINQEYLDLTNKKKYVAFGTASSADWVVMN